MKTLGGKPKYTRRIFGSNGVNEGAIGVFMSGHDEPIHAALIESNAESLIEIHGGDPETAPMYEIAQRIRARYKEIGLNQKQAAEACGCSTAQFGNYCAMNTNNRVPDVHWLPRLARGLKTTTDWLLGLTEFVPVDAQAVTARVMELDIRSVVLQLLDLEGMSRERAEVVASASQAALRLLAALPIEGDARTLALMAAQMSWQSQLTAKPS